MRRRVLRGVHFHGAGFAGISLRPVIKAIRERSGFSKLRPQTLNVKLPRWYAVYPDITILAHEYGHHEHLFFERCEIYGKPGLILRSSQNHWGSHTIEILSEEWIRRNHRIRAGGKVAVTVWIRGPKQPNEVRGYKPGGAGA